MNRAIVMRWGVAAILIDMQEVALARASGSATASAMNTVLATEARLQRYRNADRWPVDESLAAMLDSQMAAYHAVKSAIPDLTLAVGEALSRLSAQDARLIYAGAGASARLAVQDGVELFPTFGWPLNRLEYCIAGGHDALTRSIEGAEDDLESARHQLAKLDLSPADVLIAVSASGRTPFTCECQALACRAGALTIGVAGNPGSPLLADADCKIALNCGAEFLAGSTRMAAGTAQKMALNLFSTQVMMGLGHVYDGLMVDVVATNAKLRKRSVDIVKIIGGVDDKTAFAALEKAGGKIKIAVLLLEGYSREDAEHRLAAASNHLREARVFE